jgi:hypothetical protein
MYLETWMIVTICIAFGACAFISRRQGFVVGAMNTLQALEEQRYIKVEEDGSIKRWTPYNDLPVKKAKKRVDKSK